MSALATERRYMRRALALALRGRGTTAPNPRVGAVVVRDGRIVGEGFTQPYGGAHAEVQALAAAGASASGAAVYVTLEPCAGHGRTPPCVDALIAANVARVVFAASDPNPQMRGGADLLRAAGIEVLGGIDEQLAMDQNPAFFHRFVSDRPFVTLKLARTIDGAIADARRVPGWLTGTASRREVHRQRGDHDAVAVGVGTVLADDPQLTARSVPPPRVPPTRVVFDRMGRIPVGSALVGSAGTIPVIVVAENLTAPARSALEQCGVHVLQASGLTAQLQALRGAGIHSIYCEGGATLADALLADGLVDRLVIFTAPVRLGADAVRPLQSGAPVHVDAAARHRLVSHRRLGDDLMAIYDLTPSVHRTR
ncbi:MAG TPA: bifunctional diaminohydroxyphosphoribosylaminopyrimidine deaminase/5-amino-6-(5-phosphoribosylamino)uracil reductase RibD [Gemmatimonadaceae bacterium]|nr:bifunctional diaminohydroxyphosphoribosylaminopyrimidine deaminase/5-amino-6-(5-phosphoribosylamino)uracil reductase RibD [Gemmatimonadaceae bacterium]